MVPLTTFTYSRVKLSIGNGRQRAYFNRLLQINYVLCCLSPIIVKVYVVVAIKVQIFMYLYSVHMYNVHVHAAPGVL